MNRIDKMMLTAFAVIMLLVFCGGSTFDNNQPEKITTEPTIAPQATPIPAPLPTPTPTLEPIYYTEDEVTIVAKVLYDECRGVASDTEKACIVWTICNRVDAGYGVTITDVVVAHGQFAYRRSAPVWEELYELAHDVLRRWNDERNGKADVGRVLPSDYLWYSGWGGHNHFRNDYNAAYGYWDYSLTSPYSS